MKQQPNHNPLLGATPNPPAPTVVQPPAPPTAQDVYSGQNINNYVNSPTPRPNLSDPFGLYDHFMNSQDILDARKQVATTQGLINQSQSALRTTTRALENQNEK